MSAENVGEVVGLTVVDLTGARGNNVQKAKLGPAGFDGDREFLLYTEDEAGGYKRFSQKQYPELAQLMTAVDHEWGGMLVQRDPDLVRQGAARPGDLIVSTKKRGEIVWVDEFGQRTPCYALGTRVAEGLFQLLGIPGVYMGQKTEEWLSGGVTPPAERSVAALHIGLLSTVRATAPFVRGGELNPNRLRAGMLIDGFPPHADFRWVGGTLLVGDAIIPVDAHTKRCNVPGNDQVTGQKMGDVPAAYKRHTNKAPDDGAPVLGVYGHLAGNEPVEVHVGDKVRFIPKERA